jgi:hypothetical protein
MQVPCLGDAAGSGRLVGLISASLLRRQAVAVSAVKRTWVIFGSSEARVTLGSTLSAVSYGRHGFSIKPLVHPLSCPEGGNSFLCD